MSRQQTDIPPAISAMRKAGLLRALDIFLVESVFRTHGIESASLEAWLALALVSRAVDDGHACIDWSATSDEWLFRNDMHGATFTLSTQTLNNIATAFKKLLEQADHGLMADFFRPFASIIGGSNTQAPFILKDTRLYLRRYWEYEQAVSKSLTDMVANSALPYSLDVEKKKLLETLFSNPRQRHAACLALTNRLTIITGGPGTGKTFVAARILALLSHCLAAESGSDICIRMAAPTGKAAAKMDESIRSARELLGTGTFKERILIPPACTLDRLLGRKETFPLFKYNSQNLLPADVVMIDEASMVDLAKMAKLLDALRPCARLILFGDHNQLASVQPGSVMAELCESKKLSANTVVLSENFRFGRGSPLGRLSSTILAAKTEHDAAAAWDCCKDDSIENHTAHGDLLEDAAFIRAVLDGYGNFLAVDQPTDVFDALKKFRVLCALRHGPWGVLHINQVIEDILSLRSLPENIRRQYRHLSHKLDTRGEFYDHRIIMVTRNDYTSNLFNGDIGVVLPDPEANGQKRVYFQRSASAHQHEPLFSKIPPTRLPEHETAFAMTIHKSQGSEFEQVLALFPADPTSQILTKELLYTAITRAAGTIKIWCNEDVFKKTVLRQTRRFSGLREALDA